MKKLGMIINLLLGILFGIALTKGEAISFYRIQEMFRFESFHMYGIIGSSIAVGMISLQLIKRFQIRNINGDLIAPIPLTYKHGNIIGGVLFGLGWALVGACPGPLFALAGMGTVSIWIAILGALSGTLVYGMINKVLPD